MNDVFEFITSASGGIAHRGTISLGFGTPVNTATLFVDPSRIDEGAIEGPDMIQIWCVTSTMRFEVFRGVVSKLSRVGDAVRIDAVTVGALTLVDKAPVRSWANTTALAVLQDLISSSRLGVQSVSFPEGLSEKFLHVWSSDGESVSDEILQLLGHVDSSMVLHADAFGRTIIGTRDAVALSLPAMVYPFDESVGDTDSEVTRFSLRSAMVGAICLNADGTFAGTLSAVRHEIGTGYSHTDLILDDAPSPAIQALVGSAVTNEIFLGGPLDEGE